jgi:hypothetical protein
VLYRLFPLLALAFLAPALPADKADSAPDISADRIKAAVAYLASDRLEGRGPGTRGEFLATEYLADESRKPASSRSASAAPTSSPSRSCVSSPARNRRCGR